jgi:hypothetical protein
MISSNYAMAEGNVSNCTDLNEFSDLRVWIDFPHGAGKKARRLHPADPFKQPQGAITTRN